jgi:hypothetical protein
MCERHKGPNSFWAPYLRNLPSVYSDILHWTKEELSLLPSFTATAASALQLKAQESCHRLMKHFLPKLSRKLPQFEGCFSWDLYKWALSSVNTRCVYMPLKTHSVLNNEEDNFALAPFLDLLNHSSDVEVSSTLTFMLCLLIAFFVR